MGWTESNKTDPQGDWGQGSVNNAIEWGRAALNNAINWGWGHSRTLGHAVTNLVGGGGLPFSEYFDFAFKSWGDLPETGVVKTANQVNFIKANNNYIKLDNPVLLTGDWKFNFVIERVGTVLYLIGNSASASYMYASNTGVLIRVNDGTVYQFTSIIVTNDIVKIRVDGLNLIMNLNGIDVQTILTTGADITFNQIARRGATKYGTGGFRYLYYKDITQEGEYLFTEGVGYRVYSSLGSNHGTFKTDNADPLLIPTWTTGVDTPIKVGTQTSLINHNNYDYFNGIDNGIIVNSGTGTDLTGQTVTCSFIHKPQTNRTIRTNNFSGSARFTVMYDILGDIGVGVYNGTAYTRFSVTQAQLGISEGDKVTVVAIITDYGNMTFTVNGITGTTVSGSISAKNSGNWIGYRAGANYFDGIVLNVNEFGIDYNSFNDWNGATKVGTFNKIIIPEKKPDAIVYLEDFGAIADGTINTTTFLNPVYGGTDNITALINAVAFTKENNLTLTSKTSDYFRIKPTASNVLNIGSNMTIAGINIILDNSEFKLSNGFTNGMQLLFSSETEVLNTKICNINIKTAANSTVSIVADGRGSWTDLNATGYSQSYFISVKEKMDIEICNIETWGVDRVLNLGDVTVENKYNIHDCKFNDCLMGMFLHSPVDSDIYNIEYSQPRGRSQLWHGVYVGEDSLKGLPNRINNITGIDLTGKMVKMMGNAAYTLDTINGEFMLPNDALGVLKPDWSTYLYNGNSSGCVYAFRGNYIASNIEVLNRNVAGNLFRGITANGSENFDVSNATGGNIGFGMYQNSNVDFTDSDSDYDSMIRMDTYTVVGFNSILTANLLRCNFGDSSNLGGGYFWDMFSQNSQVTFDVCVFDFTLRNGVIGWLFNDKDTVFASAFVKVKNSTINIDGRDESLYIGASNARLIDNTTGKFELENVDINFSYTPSPTDFIHGRKNGFLTINGATLINVNINQFHIANKISSNNAIFQCTKSFVTLSDINIDFTPSLYQDIRFNVGVDIYKLDTASGVFNNFIATDWVSKVWEKADTVKNSLGEHYVCITVGTGTPIEPTVSDLFVNNGWEWGKIDSSKEITNPTYTKI